MADGVRIDGVACDRVPADDRGLAYGDGVFRTVRVASGRLVYWPDHLERLGHDCAALKLNTPAAVDLERDAAQLFAEGGDGVLKILITRGSAGRGYTPTGSGTRRIVSAHALPASNGPAKLALTRSPITLACQPRLAGVKHLNRLEQVLARDDCAQRGVADAWMADAAGFVISTTMRNLFFLDADGGWVTPAITRAGIIGATRSRLLRRLTQAGQSVTIRDVARDELTRFTGALACNSVGGVLAVTRIDETALRRSETASEHARKLLNQD